MKDVLRVGKSLFEISKLPKEYKLIYDQLVFVQNKILNLINEKAVLLKCKNSYIEDLKYEIVQSKPVVRFLDNLNDE